MLSSSRREPPRRQTLDETALALDETLIELEVVVRLVHAELRAASRQATPDVIRRAGADVERSVRAVATRVRRLGDAAAPVPIRTAGIEAERRVDEAAERIHRAAEAGTPAQARSASREAERLVRQAAALLRQASASTRPRLIRNAARVDVALDRGQRRLFRILWFTVPPGSVAWDLHFQALLVSRFLTDIALQALLYGTLIAVVRRGGGAFDAALVGTAFLLPGVLLGLHGGAVADAMSKRVALAGAYITMGLLCFAVPPVLGTGFKSLLIILFAVRTLHQVSQPSEASAVPLVADAEELASANSFMSLASSAGEVIGKAAIAPLVVQHFGVEPVVMLAGVLFFLAFTRVFELTPPRELARQARTRLLTDNGAAIRWLLGERRVFWMLLLAGLATTVGVVLSMLGPVYVAEALDIDPAYTLYVFMPAAAGLMIALLVAPRMIAASGERLVVAIGFTIAASAMFGFGTIDPLTERVVPWLIEFPGVTRQLEVAAGLSVPLGFGITLAAAAAQTYVGRSVPTDLQGRMFAIMGVLKDGLAIVPLLGLAAAAGVLGSRPVLAAAPLVLLALALTIDLVAGRFRTARCDGAEQEAVDEAGTGHGAHMIGS
ncbi:MAG: MFS transporter [Dehalococcoidia bacterium]